MINNKIQEAYCSFEVSKLLKEKGFNIGSEHYYDSELPYHGDLFYNYKDDFPTLYERPTHALAIEWIRVNFGIFIQITWVNNNTFRIGCIEISTRIEHIVRNEQQQLYFNSPQEATEAALLYTLQNLIP